jgi:hypothetical protein
MRIMLSPLSATEQERDQAIDPPGLALLDIVSLAPLLLAWRDVRVLVLGYQVQCL